MPSPYSRPYITGTVSITNGETSLVGTGTAWQVSPTAPLLMEGDELSLNGITVPIASIDSDTTATLELPWPGSTVTNGAYAIIKRSLKRFSPAEAQDRATKFLLQLQGMTPVYHVEDDETVPDPSRGEDGDVALKITAGVWRLWRYIDGDGWVEQSPAAGVAAGIRLAYDNSTSDADPGAGEFRLNHATPASATAAYIDNVDAAGATISGILDLWDDSTSTVKGILRFQHETDPDIWAQFQVTGSVVDGTGYRKLTLANGQGSGAFTAADKFSMLFVRSGDKGETGSATASSDVAWSGDISPSSLSADQDDYNPSGLSNAAVIRHAASAEVAINGSAGGADGRLMIDANISAYALKRNAERASSTAANRNAGPDIEIDPGAAGLRIYDATTQRWRPVAPRLKPLHLHAQPDPFPTVPHKPTVYANWAAMPWLDRYFTFARASTASYYDRKGILRYAPSGVPRFSTIYSSGESGLLIEGSRTNLLPRSEEFDNASWGKGDITASANTMASPDGLTTAEKLVEAATTANHQVTQAPSFVNGTAYTVSFFAKAAERSFVAGILQSTAFTGGVNVRFNLSTGAVAANSNATSAGIEALPNGWYRCWFTATASATTAAILAIRLYNAADSYAGDGTSGLYVWGAQLEAGAFPSSYIPTTSASVTRAADVCYRTLADVVNANEFAFFFETVAPAGAIPSGSRVLGAIGNNAASFGADLYFVQNAAGTSISLSPPSAPVNVSIAVASNIATKNKAIGAMIVNNARAAVNGTLGTADTSNAVPTSIDRFWIGSAASWSATSEFFGLIQKAAYWPTSQLTNAQMQTITT